MSNHVRRFPTRSFVDPTFKKRKERERDGFDVLKPKLAKLSSSTSAPVQPSACKNQLLAGYLAHEFLTKGTLLGKPYGQSDSSRAVGLKAEPREEEEMSERYDEVTDLLKTEMAHLPGIVNPAQLAQFFQI